MSDWVRPLPIFDAFHCSFCLQYHMGDNFLGHLANYHQLQTYKCDTVNKLSIDPVVTFIVAGKYDSYYLISSSSEVSSDG